MNRNEFFDVMKKTLDANHVADIEEILSEYEQHFAFKLADGYSEEEIAAKLGDPKELAGQFAPEKSFGVKARGNRIMVAVGLAFADLFAGSLFIVLYAWVAAMGAGAAGSAVIGAVLLTGQNIYGILPFIPYASAVFFAVSFLLLAVLFTVAAVYCCLLFNQLFRAYGRWHHNSYATAAEKPVYPSLSKFPQMSPKAKRRLRGVAWIALILFVVFFTATFIVSSALAGSAGFWHAWNWFV